MCCNMMVGLMQLKASESDPRIEGIGNRSNVVEYAYRYSVDESKSMGPVMDRWEQRIGEYVKGAYSVVEPDGRIRTVDYEVDGGNGYHAVIRMNPPGPGLLSVQQLRKSMEVFPEAEVPGGALKASASSNVPTRNARNHGKFWNYHSKSPYINGIAKAVVRESGSENRGSSSGDGRLPPGPANYNVPQTRNLIHFLEPAAYILGKKRSGSGAERKPSADKWEATSGGVGRQRRRREDDEGGEDAERPRVRNSKLVRRFKRMRDHIGDSSAAAP